MGSSCWWTADGDASGLIGASLSGVLTPFPLAIAIIAGFAHVQAGSVAARSSLRAFIPGLCTFGVFCFVLSPALRFLTLPAAFSAALVVQLMLQGVILWRSPGTASSRSTRCPSDTLNVVGRE